MPSEQLNNELPNFLIDTGSEINLIKIGSLENGIEIKKNKTYSLAGISDQLINTLGQVTIKFNDISCNFNVVKNDFPITEDGILGIEFLKSEQCTLSFPDPEVHVVISGSRIAYKK